MLGERPDRPFKIAEEQRRTLVRRKPRRETDGQRVGREDVVEKTDIVGIEPEMLLAKAFSGELDKLPPE